MRKVLSYLCFWFISLTWGGLMTFIGAIVAVVLLLTGHKPHKFGPNIYFVVGKHNWGGLELGAFFLIDKSDEYLMKLHEAGHGLQNLIWGPLMPFVISIPSAIRYWYREYIRKKDIDAWVKLPSYYSIWFEGQASRWGLKVYGGIK